MRKNDHLAKVRASFHPGTACISATCIMLLACFHGSCFLASVLPAMLVIHLLYLQKALHLCASFSTILNRAGMGQCKIV